MNEQFMQMYQKLAEDCADMGYSEEYFYEHFSGNLVIMLEYLYNYEDKAELIEAIENGWLETLIPADILVDVPDVEESYRMYTMIRDFKNKPTQPQQTINTQVQQPQEDEMFDLDLNEDAITSHQEPHVEYEDGGFNLDFNEEVEQPQQNQTPPPQPLPNQRPTIITVEPQQETQQQPSEEPSEPDISQSIININEKTPTVIDGAIAYCTSCEMLATKNKKNYLKLSLKDTNDSTISALLFNYSGNAEQAKSFNNSFVTLKGKWDVYNGNDNLKLDNVTTVTSESMAKYGVTKDDFLPKADNSLKEYAQMLLALIQNTSDEDYKRLLHHIFIDKKYLDKYLETPAGISYHHPAKGQLVQHVCEVAQIANGSASVFNYIPLNMDLVIAGCLLHDIGKVIELPTDGSMNYTYLGAQLGHIALGISMVSQFAFEIGKFPNKKLMDLIHIIASHHGDKEKGSPVDANTPEAMLVHMSDEMSGFMNHVWINVKNLKPNEETIFEKGKNYLRLS